MEEITIREQFQVGAKNWTRVRFELSSPASDASVLATRPTGISRTILISANALSVRSIRLCFEKSVCNTKKFHVFLSVGFLMHYHAKHGIT